MLKSVTKNHEFSPTEIDSETETDMPPQEELEGEVKLGSNERKIRVIDRFGLIL